MDDARKTRLLEKKVSIGSAVAAIAASIAATIASILTIFSTPNEGGGWTIFSSETSEGVENVQEIRKIEEKAILDEANTMASKSFNHRGGYFSADEEVPKNLRNIEISAFTATVVGNKTIRYILIPQKDHPVLNAEENVVVPLYHPKVNLVPCLTVTELGLSSATFPIEVGAVYAERSIVIIPKKVTLNSIEIVIGEEKSSKSTPQKIKPEKVDHQFVKCSILTETGNIISILPPLRMIASG